MFEIEIDQIGASKSPHASYITFNYTNIKHYYSNSIFINLSLEF